MSRVAEKQENFVTRVDEKQQHFMGKTTEELNFAVEDTPFKRFWRSLRGLFEVSRGFLSNRRCPGRRRATGSRWVSS